MKIDLTTILLACQFSLMFIQLYFAMKEHNNWKESVRVLHELESYEKLIRERLEELSPSNPIHLKDSSRDVP